MKIKEALSILSLLILTLIAPQAVSAQSAGGTYQFTFEDRYTKYLDFDAKTQADGSATGRIFFSDEAKFVYNKDVDGEGLKEVTYAGFSFTASVDGLEVNKNQAVISGTIRESSIPELVGQRVLLTVEDNGDNTRVLDRLTWGVYKPLDRSWTPSDAERKVDEGVGLRWWATDAERRDDTGYQMPRDESITTKSFPVASYAFVNVSTATGDIIVQP